MRNLILLILLVPSLARAWTDGGINFRDSAGYVTDGTDETYCLGDADPYPTTRAGITFGWSTIDGDSGRDRNSSVDRRLAGINQCSNDGTPCIFRLDLFTSGTKSICLALGDYGSNQDYQKIEFLDDTTSLFTITDTDGTVFTNFNDASGVNRTAAAWPGSNVCVEHTFATTTMIVKLGSTSAQANSSTIAHLRVTDVSPTPTPTPTSTVTARKGQKCSAAVKGQCLQ